MVDLRPYFRLLTIVCFFALSFLLSTMSWIIRDPPSPLAGNSPKLEDTHSKPEGTPVATPKADPPRPLSPLFSPPTLWLDLIEEQWSTNPLRIKSTFSTAGTRIQSLTSPACGMGWTFNLDLPGGQLKKKSVTRPKSGLKSQYRSSASFAPVKPSGVSAWNLIDSCVI
ncbi:hypothetical protein EV421DRAFT_973055 [Armillaria borealis]|uniref:Uncharacterized protein n=1 Tax=Armillaria borealis TaxID=47425 RepID=A0AA39MKH7_9AGAR|nr:hypothetical protein EV421DRAFT_973055 [Armillaria borealis]